MADQTDASLLAKLEEIQARVDKATKGQWYWHSVFGTNTVSHWAAPPTHSAAASIVGPIREHDAEFIAHAKSDIPYLLAALRRSGEALRRLQEEKIESDLLIAILQTENARQSGAEGTEAGGRSQPLAPTTKGIL